MDTGLQDLEIQYLIISAIDLATEPLKNSIKKFGLRLRKVLHKYIQVIINSTFADPKI